MTRISRRTAILSLGSAAGSQATFTGAAILLRNKAAYTRTSFRLKRSSATRTANRRLSML